MTMDLTLILGSISIRSVVILLCLPFIFGIPIAAARRKLHIPGYVGIALASLIMGLLVGRVSGLRGVSGTRTGFSLSILFFLLIASTVGSIIALFFYRHPDV
jgi:lysylphosphatidylglycerol synthetase-like protein (DUF2156 family)